MPAAKLVSWAEGDEKYFSSFIVSYGQFRERMLGINDLQDAALFATIYCGYARVGEIARPRTRETTGITKGDIEFTPTHLALSILTEKTNIWRKVLTNAEKERWLHAIILDWLSACPTYELFPHNTNWARLRFKKWFGNQHIHLLRHWACTHAMQGHRTNETLAPYEVARLGGWTNLDSFYRTYSHFCVEDFAHKI